MMTPTERHVSGGYCNPATRVVALASPRFYSSSSRCLRKSGRWILGRSRHNSGIGNILLEYVNYIQHYGLRCEVGGRQTTMHSWESLSLWSRWTLMELPLHPAHHQKSSDPIWALRSHPESPQMLVGYYGLFWPCTIPPLWRRLMDHRIP